MEFSIQKLLGATMQSCRAKMPAYFTYNLTGARFYCGADGNYRREGERHPIEKGLQRSILAGEMSEYTVSDSEYEGYFLNRRPETPAFLISSLTP